MRPGVGAWKRSSLGVVMCRVTVSRAYCPISLMGRWRQLALRLGQEARPCPGPTSFLFTSPAFLRQTGDHLLGPPPFSPGQVSPHGVLGNMCVQGVHSPGLSLVKSSAWPSCPFLNLRGPCEALWQGL